MAYESKTVSNEKAKLTASYLNGLALAVLTVGGFSPFVLKLQGNEVNLETGYFALSCIALSVIIHWIARSLLERIVE